MTGKRGGRGLAACAAVVIAGAVALGWWAGRSGQPDRTPGLTAIQSPTPAASGRAAPPAADASVGQSDPFAALDCRARQYNDTLALAVTFTQPLDRKADLSAYLHVADAGAAPLPEDAAPADAAAPVQHGDGATKGKPLPGAWVVGDNPRVAYFPYVQPQRLYGVRLAAGGAEDAF